VKRILVVLLVLAVVAMVAIRGFDKRGSKPDPAAAAAPVAEFLPEDLVTATVQPLEQLLRITGTLAPLAEALIKAKLAGELSEIAVREGESVRRGVVVARIDTAEVSSRVAARSADVEAARAQLGLAEKNRSTQLALLDKGFISRNAFDSTSSSQEVAAARLRAAEADLATARKALADTVMASPIDGVVAERYAQPGERVAVDARILSIVDLARLELSAAIPAAEIGRIRIGQRVSLRVEGLGERTFSGQIERINPATTTGTRAIEIYTVIDNPARLLRAGMFVRGDVLIERVEAALIIPGSAVRAAGAERHVYTLDGGVIARRAVTVGASDGAGQVQILSGLSAGDQVVRNNLGALREGSAARVAKR